MRAAEGSAEQAVCQDDAVTARLWTAITEEFLRLVSWSDGVMSFPQDHVLLGWQACGVLNCGQRSVTAVGLCSTCVKRWAKHDQPPLAQFVLVERIRVREWQPGMCVVPGCARPWQQRSLALCRGHHRARGQTTLSITEFAADPAVTGLPGFGRCEVVACVRARDSSRPYCPRHSQKWRQFRNAAEAGQPDEQHWRRTQAAIAVGGEVSLRGLSARVVAELLFGLQQRTTDGTKTKPFFFRRVADHLRAQEAPRLDAASLEGLILEETTLARHFIAFARRQCSDPETERRRDVWDTAVFGFGGALRFTDISQPWLREATKVMAYNDLPLHRGQGAKQYCQSRISYLALLSQSLRLQRSDEGRDPSSLDRTASPPS
ncbi:hypothetical protein [Nocardia abscessus]|uniref:hypothetical protein n=1 Tax=Nocardia abscessus TaxID=120957 RepID=UPI002453FE60|nr:hypothetical protein [Nocardia abscessus]